RFLLVPVHGFEYPDDMGALGIGQRGEAVARWRGHRAAAVEEPDVLGPDDAARGGEGRSGDRALQIPDVARARVADHQIPGRERGRLAGERQALWGAVPGEETLCERLDVRLALAKRREADGEGVVPVVGGLANAPVGKDLIVGGVGRRDEAE